MMELVLFRERYIHNGEYEGVPLGLEELDYYTEYSWLKDFDVKESTYYTLTTKVIDSKRKTVKNWVTDESGLIIPDENGNPKQEVQVFDIELTDMQVYKDFVNGLPVSDIHVLPNFNWHDTTNQTSWLITAIEPVTLLSITFHEVSEIEKFMTHNYDVFEINDLPRHSKTKERFVNLILTHNEKLNKGERPRLSEYQISIRYITLEREDS